MEPTRALILLLIVSGAVAYLCSKTQEEYPMCSYCANLVELYDERRCKKCHALKCSWVGGTRWCVYEPKKVGK